MELKIPDSHEVLSNVNMGGWTEQDGWMDGLLTWDPSLDSMSRWEERGEPNSI